MFLAQGFIDPATLDQLVKLAALGTSGICVLALVLIGMLIHNIPEEHRERHRSVRMYMWICVIIALISAGSGAANAYYNHEKIEKESAAKKAAINEVSQIRSETAAKTEEFKRQESALNHQLAEQKKANELLMGQVKSLGAFASSPIFVSVEGKLTDSERVEWKKLKTKFDKIMTEHQPPK